MVNPTWGQDSIIATECSMSDLLDLSTELEMEEMTMIVV